MGGEMMKGCGLVVVEEKERKRGPDEEHQNIQSTVLASPLCLPELLVALFHRGRCGYRVLEQLICQLCLVGQVRNQLCLELTDLQKPGLRLLDGSERILSVP